MNRSKLRRQIAWEAARLMYLREESEYFRAKQKAAHRICQGWVKPADLPSNAEIRDEIQSFARLHEGDARTDNLREMRLEALRLMRLLARFRPRLIGSVMTGHVRAGSDIDLHVFSDSIESVVMILDEHGLVYDVERKRVRKDDEERVYTHVHVQDRYPFELTVYAADMAHHVFKSSITGKAIERSSIAQLEQFMAAEYPDLDLEAAIAEVAEKVDRFQVYQSLLLPLENVKQNLKYHPEGEALYHSLQVFDHARDQLPYDEEFLLAALLHDVGKAIDPHEHVAAGLEALDGFITERTKWLIEHHMEGHAILDSTIGSRSHRRLKESESYEELVLLARCDRAGRQFGAQAPELDEALDYIRELATTFG
ncbi:MAG TPA: HD domain-containing protein [Pirellulaceae bacterium]|nr:HD domain-containing protein [Pirellulaceae bacterium]